MQAPRTYRKRPIETQAMQWTGDNEADLMAWCGNDRFRAVPPEDRGEDPDITAELWVDANGRWLPLNTGEWVLRDTAGFYPCKDDVFASTYIPVETPA